MRHARALAVSLLLATSACATGSSAGGADRPGRQPNVLTHEDVRSAQQSNLYDVVLALRPMWLRDRGQISIMDPGAGQVVVFLNSVQAGGVEYLRQVSAVDVASVRYFNAAEAASIFGTRTRGGAAIQIHTLTGPR